MTIVLVSQLFSCHISCYQLFVEWLMVSPVMSWLYLSVEWATPKCWIACLECSWTIDAMLNGLFEWAVDLWRAFFYVLRRDLCWLPWSARQGQDGLVFESVCQLLVIHWRSSGLGRLVSMLVSLLVFCVWSAHSARLHDMIDACNFWASLRWRHATSQDNMFSGQ